MCVCVRSVDVHTPSTVCSSRPIASMSDGEVKTTRDYVELLLRGWSYEVHLVQVINKSLSMSPETHLRRLSSQLSLVAMMASGGYVGDVRATGLRQKMFVRLVA